MNTKYMSSNVLKISVFSRMRSTCENADVSIHEIHGMFGINRKPKKSKLSFYFRRTTLFTYRLKTEPFPVISRQLCMVQYNNCV